MKRAVVLLKESFRIGYSLPQRVAVSVGLLFLLVFITPLSAQMNWTCATQSAQWKIRSSQSSIAFDNKLWMLNGYVANSEMYNDAWFTTDGTNWTCANTKTPYGMSTGMGCVVFKEKLWLLGGRDGC